jgi:hypothetical protein
MAVRFKISAQGAVIFDRALQRFADDIQHFQPAFGVIHDDFIDIETAQFATKGRRGPGGAWADYSGEPAYRAMKESILRQAGVSNAPEELICRWVPRPGREILYPSIVSPSHPMHIYSVSDKSAAFGTSAPHAQAVNDGQYQEWDRKMAPGRKLIDLNRRDEERWAKILHLYVFQLQRGAFENAGSIGDYARKLRSGARYAL